MPRTRTGRSAAAWRWPWLELAAVSAIVGLSGVPGALAARQATARPVTDPRPNILWITSEDNGPALGAYGDAYATTPNLDALAARGFRYRVAWSNGPVCGAARSTLITGVHAESTGGEHMRSSVDLPAFIRMYPQLLREAGYYVTNNSKTDYNYPEVGQVWDESSGRAHWKNRPAGKPFFAVFNIMQSHESQIRLRPHSWMHDVATAPVPPYMPNVQASREDWAQYYDQVSVMDGIAGERLAELEAAGLTDDTIVMYFGDHGAGLPRSKRFPNNSGLQVPLVVYIPPKYRELGPPEASQAGSVSDRLVSFVDLAPTLVSLAGVEPPAWMQGLAFLGPYRTPDPEYIYGFRGRMDERYDLVRAVRDQRFIYLRNYMPHRPYGQHVAYMFQTPTTVVWNRMFEDNLLPPIQAAFWGPKPTEELYDLQDDPYETRNLAASPEHAGTLKRLRHALDVHARDIRDVGFLPEYELQRHETTPYERGHDPTRYDFDAIYAAAQVASDRSVGFEAVRPGLSEPDPVVRYWAATGMVVRGREAVAATAADLMRLLRDPEPGPRIAAAEALGRFGTDAERDRAIEVLLEDAAGPLFVAQLALYTLNQIEHLPQSVLERVAQLPPMTAGRGRAGSGQNRGDQRANLKNAIAQDVR